MLVSLQKNRIKGQTGFTIIELLVATLVFSIVLIVVLSAFVQTSRLFYKGVNMDNTQEATRTITQDISDDIKFDQSAPDTFLREYNSPTTPDYDAATHSGRFCIGLHRYSYQLGQQTDGGGLYGVKRETISTAVGCPAAGGSQSEELLDNGMQLNAIGINCSNGRCTINVHVVFYGGDNAVLDSSNGSYSTNKWQAPDAECTGGVQTSQFCAVADFNRTVTILAGA